MGKYRRLGGPLCRRSPRCATVVMLCLVGILLLLPAAVNAQVLPKEDILAGRWSEVARTLQAVSPDTPSAKLRMGKGHACLALNRNNESIELFASALNDVDREEWLECANDFAVTHPENAIAWYLKGDAHARSKNWQTAAAALDKAIELDDKCYLAMNARGVVYHATGKLSKAQDCFDDATKAKSDFADAHASKGTAKVYENVTKILKQEERSEDALDYFRQAEKLSEDKRGFALSVIGRGSLLCALGRYPEARSCFLNDDLPDCLLPLARRNLLVTEVDKLGNMMGKDENAGMSLLATELEGPMPGWRLVRKVGKLEVWHDTANCDYWAIYCIQGCKKYKVRRIKKGNQQQTTSQIAVELLPALQTIRLPVPVPVDSTEELRQLTTALGRMTVEVNRFLALAPPVKQPEGADTDIKEVRVARPCGVCNVYGLLYLVRPANEPKWQRTGR